MDSRFRHAAAMQPARAITELNPSYIREILAAATSPGVISLAGGLPAESSFPLDLMRPAIDALADDPALFQYGSTRGYGPLVDAVKAQLGLDDDRDLVVCAGSQQALDLVARTFLDPGDGVVMEAPCYLGALQVFQLARASIRAVPQTPDGPDLDRLEAAFRAGGVKLFYAVPDFHNPTGVCWTGPVREAVAELCLRHGVILLEDSPYRQIRFAGEEPPLASAYCPGQSILLRSFSKTVAPGLRLGIAAGPRQWIDLLVRVKQAADLHTAVPQQAILRQVLTDPRYPAHIQRVCGLYGARYAALGDAIRRHLSPGCSYEPVSGGMFVWVTLTDLDTMALASRAIESGVAVVPGDVFYPGNDAPGSYLRLNFSHTPMEDFDDALQRLAACIPPRG